MTEMERDYLVCGFTGRVPGSVMISCVECGGEMFVAPSGQQALIGNPALVPICMDCALPRMREQPHAVRPMTPFQETELLANGITREQVDELYGQLGIKRDG